MTGTRETSDFVRAAEGIEQELRRLEEFALAVRKMRLHTDRSIARAARELQDAMAQQETLAQGLRLFGEAMLRMQERQHAAVEGLGTSALEIQRRAQRMSEHMERYGALGTRAAGIAGALQLLAPGGGAALAGAAASDAETVARLVDVEQGLSSLADDAKALATQAQGEDFTDIAREADAMKQRIQATRSQLERLVRERSAGVT